MEEVDKLPYEPRHLLLWTSALANAFEGSGLWRKIPGFRFAAYGFADPETEADAFGVLAHAAPIPGARDEIMTVDVTIEKGALRFPVFVRRSFEVLHGSLGVDPSKGTAACWAESRRLSTARNFGVLTAKHVGASVGIGGSISTTCGAGTLLDLGPDGIDAALVEAPAIVSRPTALSPLSVNNLIPPWTDVSLVGTYTSVTTKVTAVTDTRGSLSWYIPARLFLAQHGQPGDSGALVALLNGDAVGLYMGLVVDASGRTEGLCQHLGQVSYCMDLQPLM